MTGSVVLILVTLLPLGVAVVSLFAPPARGPIAAVFPPWWGDRRAFVAASTAGPVVRFGAVPFIVVVAAAGNDRALLYAAGAWLLLDPRSVGGCTATDAGQT